MPDATTPKRTAKFKARGRTPRNPRERVRCSACNAIVAGRVPKDGDGSGVFPVWHKHDGEPCDGRFHEGSAPDA